MRLKTRVVAHVGKRSIVTRKEDKGVVFYLSRGFLMRQLEVVGKVAYDRTDKPTSFEEQMEIVSQRAITRAKVKENHDAGLV